MKRPARLLDTDQVARRFSVSPDTVRNWIRKDRIPATNIGRPGGRPTYRIDAAALDQFITDNPAGANTEKV